jgi:putative transposase
MITKAYKFQIKPNEQQCKLLQRWFGCVRFVYNWGLDKKIKHYEKSKEDGFVGNKYLTYYELAKQLTLEKQTEEHSFLNECPSESLQQLRIPIPWPHLVNARVDVSRMRTLPRQGHKCRVE